MPYTNNNPNSNYTVVNDTCILKISLYVRTLYYDCFAYHYYYSYTLRNVTTHFLRSFYVNAVPSTTFTDPSTLLRSTSLLVTPIHYCTALIRNMFFFFYFKKTPTRKYTSINNIA